MSVWDPLCPVDDCHLFFPDCYKRLVPTGHHDLEVLTVSPLLVVIDHETLKLVRITHFGGVFLISVAEKK